MAGTKEAIAIVLDVGPGMNQAPPGEQTALQTSLNAINMILQRKLFSESKDEVALILFGTPGTANELADNESYMNVTVARPLGVVDWELLEYVQNDVQPSNMSGDFLDALVVAMDHVVRGLQGKKGFVSRRVILLSNVNGEFGDDNLDDIVASFKEQEIEFNVIGPNLDDDDEDDDGGPSGASNSHEKEKTPQQRAGEAMLKHMIEKVNGASYSFSEALPALSYFQSRAVRPTPWKCPLEIGASLTISVSGYIKVKEAKSKTFKNVYARDPDAAIQRLKTFHLNDEEETEIEQSDIVDGHRYGSTLVPFSGDDQDAMKFRATKCFKVLGFTKSEKAKRSHMMGDSCLAVVSDKGDEVAAVALSALIAALYETNMVAIVRRVYSAASSPRIGVLTPHIKANYECLFYNDLPFAEDVRQYTFGSLPIADEQATQANKKFQPTDQQLAAMDDLIDQMDLSKAAGDDDDDDTEEVLKPKLTFNPYLQRMYQCLQHRATNPDDALPELSSVIAEYLKPSQAVLTRCEPAVDKMNKLFKLERVVKKKENQTGDAMFKDNDTDGAPAAKKPKVDDDLGGGMAGLTKAKVTEVGTVAPVEDFKSMISQRDEDRFEEACNQMQKRIIQIICDSFGSQFYSKAVDCLKAYREESIKNSEPKQFNEYLQKLKDTLSEKGRKDFWSDVIKEKLSLITKLESEDSKVSKDEAAKFIAEEAAVKEEKPASDEDEDADDLLAMME